MEFIQEQIFINPDIKSELIESNITVDKQTISPDNNSVSLIKNPIFQSSTDHKPLCMFGFTGGYNNCLRLLHHSVKPIIGVVKYDFTTWHLFPTTIAQSKELALKWSSSFEKRKDFANKSVIIFFHIQMKTIRIEVKEKKEKKENYEQNTI